MANVTAGGGGGNPYPQYINAGRGVSTPNPAYIAWNNQAAAQAASATKARITGPVNGPPVPTADQANAADNNVAGQVQNADGSISNVNKYGRTISLAKAAPSGSSGLPLGYGAATGPTWYERQQIANDQQRMADARAAQAAQEKYQAEQAAIARSNLIEGASKDFRTAQLASTYGTINGMSYFGPKGSPVAERAPESETLKDAYAKNGTPDPWANPALYGGYTGSTFMNPQQTGQSDAMAQVHAPIAGAGAVIPPPSMAAGGNVPGTTGQPQLIVAHGGEQITPAPGTPMPQLLGSPGGAPFSNPLDPNDPMSSGAAPDSGAPIPGMPDGGPQDAGSASQGQPDIKTLIANLIQAVQAVTSLPQFADLQAPIPGSPDISAGGSPDQGAPPSMAMGGVVPSLAIPRGFLSPSSGPPSIPGYAMGGVVPSYAVGGVVGQNAYGQGVSDNVVHAPTYNDVVAGPGTLNPIMGAPGTNQAVLRGMTGFGATVTPNGTPVTMSAYQRQNLMPSTIASPGGYNDYAKQVANWDPADLVANTNRMMDSGNLGGTKQRYAPISIQPAPAGG